MKVLGIIPARGGSKGIPRKNLQLLDGVPLVGRAINQSLAAETIDMTLVSTEDEGIRETALSFGAEVIERPDEFVHDNTVQEVDRLLRWTILELENRGRAFDVVALLYATAPLREVETIDAAVRLVTEGGYDSALSLYEDATYLWRRSGDVVEPTNYDPRTRGPRQKEGWNQWTENKAVYTFRRDLLIDTGCRLGGRIGYVEMPKWRSVDVDRPEDLAFCEFMISRDPEAHGRRGVARGGLA